MRAKNLEGMRFGNLRVLYKVDAISKSGTHEKWICQCDCGEKGEFTSSTLKRRKNQCTCKASKADRDRIRRIYKGMKERCYNTRNRQYVNYGGRGVKICNSWLRNFETFYIWALKHGYSSSLSIERINVNGNYSPANCIWANKYVQANNTRRNHRIEYMGQNKTISEWAHEIGMSPNTLYYRLKRGWTIERALGFIP